MSALPAILVFGALMSVIALVGSVTLVLREATLFRILPMLVAFCLRVAYPKHFLPYDPRIHQACG